MKTRTLLVVIAVLTSLVLTGCSLVIKQIREDTPPAGSLARAKNALKAEAESGKFEVSEIKLEECYNPELTSGEKANGVQVEVWIELQFAARCKGEVQWENGYARFHITKIKGVWKTELNGNPRFPQCPPPPEPTPVPWRA